MIAQRSGFVVVYYQVLRRFLCIYMLNHLLLVFISQTDTDHYMFDYIYFIKSGNGVMRSINAVVYFVISWADL